MITSTGWHKFQSKYERTMDLGEQHEFQIVDVNLIQDRLKHIKFCKKVYSTERKVFDSTKNRVQDNPS